MNVRSPRLQKTLTPDLEKDVAPASKHTLDFTERPFDAPPVPEPLNSHRGFIQSKARPTTLDTIVLPEPTPAPPPPIHSILHAVRKTPVNNDPPDTMLDDSWFQDQQSATRSSPTRKKRRIIPFLLGIVLGTSLAVSGWAVAITTVIREL